MFYIIISESNIPAIQNTEEKVIKETAKSLINKAKPSEEEIISSKLIKVEEAKPKVPEPSANLLRESDMINNTKEVSSSVSSGADNISSKTG